MAERRVAPQQIKRVQERSAPGVVNRQLQAGEVDTSPSRATQIAQGLMDAVKGISPVIDREVKRKIELDKITQQQRFYAGELPTEDATNPGQRAYNVLQARSDVTEAQNKLLEDLEFNPDMSDEEFEERSRSIYNGQYDKYENDPLMTEALTAMFTQTQPGVLSQRNKLRSQYQYGQRVGAFRSSLSETIEASSPEELREAITTGSLRVEGDALRVHTADMQKAIWDQAKADAKDGDGRLLEAMRGIPAYAESEDFELLEKTYNGARATRDRISIGDLTADVEQAWVKGGATWEETRSKLERIGAEWPGRISEEYTRSLKLKGLKEREQSATAANVLAAFNSDYPFRVDQRFTNKEKLAGAKQLDADLALWANEAIANGQDPMDVQVRVFNEKFRYTAESGVAVGDIGKQLTFLANQSPDAISQNPGVLKTYTSLLRSLRNTDRGTLSLYASGKDLEMLEAYKYHAGSYGDEAAWRMAWSTVHESTPITPDVQKTFDKEVRTQVSDVLDAGLLDEWFGGMSDLTDRQRAQVEAEVLREAKALWQGGTRTPGVAVKGAVDTYRKNNTPLSNGTMINGNRNKIAEAAGVAPDAVPFLWERYFKDNQENLAEAAGVDEIAYSDTSVHVSPNGLWHMRGPFGVQITEARPLSELSEYGVDSKRLMELNQESREQFMARREGAELNSDRRLRMFNKKRKAMGEEPVSDLRDALNSTNPYWRGEAERLLN